MEEKRVHVPSDKGRGKDSDYLNAGGPRDVVPALQQWRKSRVAENASINGTTCPAGEDVGEVATMVNNALQHDRVKAPEVEFHRVLGAGKELGGGGCCQWPPYSWGSPASRNHRWSYEGLLCGWCSTPGPADLNTSIYPHSLQGFSLYQSGDRVSQAVYSFTFPLLLWEYGFYPPQNSVSGFHLFLSLFLAWPRKVNSICSDVKLQSKWHQYCFLRTDK